MMLKEDFENFNEPFATWLCLRQAAGGGGGGVGGDMNILLRDTGAGAGDYVTRLPLTQWNNETWPPASSRGAREEN